MASRGSCAPDKSRPTKARNSSSNRAAGKGRLGGAAGIPKPLDRSNQGQRCAPTCKPQDSGACAPREEPPHRTSRCRARCAFRA